MKKFYVLLVAMALTAGTAFAQSNDSIERAKQQEALLRQQQKEQQELLQQQQKEQERLQREQQREQERALKEQQRAEEKAEQDRLKEQERVQKEQEKALKKEQAKIEKKRKRQEHYAAWGRGPRFTVDPYASVLTDRRIYTQNNYYNSIGVNLGANLDYHRPIARHWDFNIGLGYRYTIYCYSHLGIVGDGITAASYDQEEETVNTSTLVLPIKLSHLNKDNQHGWYLGVTPGVMLNKPVYGMNRFRCDLAVGTQNRWLFFAPGTEIYFNIMPTYNTSATQGKIHEFGIRFNL